jgi:hypothetical protein
MENRRRVQNNSIKLGIGWPCYDDRINTMFVKSFLGMEKPNYGLYTPQYHGSVDQIRNGLVVQALEDNKTHLLMMDTDQIYPADTLPKMLKHKKDIVGVRVHKRWPPFDVVMHKGPMGKKRRHIPDEICFSGKLVEVDATGTGCLLFNMNVFKKIKYPWFRTRRRVTGQIVGEDIAFCRRARKEGFKIFIDTSIEVGHLSEMIINTDFYKLYKKVKGVKWQK